MGDPHLYQLSEHDMNKKIIAPHDANMLPVTQAKDNRVPAPPKLVFLTNKAGAFANPLAEDESAWLRIGWFRV
jgi:hypothetical protein